MDVSVIILNFNTYALTSACIRSIFEKTSGVTFEVILVDNGSEECHPSIFLKEFPNIVLVESKYNLGFAKGNNLGLKYARGTTVLLLNSDTQLLNNAILLAFRRMMKSPEIAALAGKLFYPNGKVQHNVQRFPSIRLLLVEIFRLFHFLSLEKRGKLLLGGYFSYEKEIFPDWVWATFLLIRRNVIAQFPKGRLHENFFMYEEDKQWGLFLRQEGFRIIFSPQPHILHYATGSNSKTKSNIVAIQKTILINEYHLISITKGSWYAKIFFFLKAVEYRTSRYEQAKVISNLYLRFALKGAFSD